MEYDGFERFMELFSLVCILSILSNFFSPLDRTIIQLIKFLRENSNSNHNVSNIFGTKIRIQQHSNINRNASKQTRVQKSERLYMSKNPLHLDVQSRSEVWATAVMENRDEHHT